MQFYYPLFVDFIYRVMKIIYYFLLLLCIVSCKKADNKSIALVDDIDVDIEDRKTLMSSFIELNNVVPLETTDSSLLGSIEKIIKFDGDFYIKSKNRPLDVFSGTGKFKKKIGSLGVGPEEYVEVGDYDVDHDYIYILTISQIQVYTQDGKFVRSIPLSLNASGIRVLKNQIVLFVLGDRNVIHVIDKDGVERQAILARNQALRICKAIPFVKYRDEYLLFAQGRSNNILAYDVLTEAFKDMTYLASNNNLSIEEEVSLMENKSSYKRELNDYGAFFDGLSSSDNHIIFGSIDKNEITLWVKDILSKEVKAYYFSSLINDLTFTSTSSFFTGNTDGEKCFLSYMMPYHIAEGLKENISYADSSNYIKMEKIIDSLDVEDANPVIIEYTFK